MRFDGQQRVMRSGGAPLGSPAAKVGTDEPYEGKLHVRVRGGRREQSRPLPGTELALAHPVRASRISVWFGFS
jgi:hypothetical protein